MKPTLADVLRSVNKLLGALAGGGVITLLVGLHVIPAGVGNTLLSVIGVAGTALGAFLAPSNKPINTDPGVPDDELDGLPIGLVETGLEKLDELTHGAVTGLVKQPGESHAFEDDRPSPQPHD